MTHETTPDLKGVMMSVAHINPRMLRWAVDRAGVRPEDLAGPMKKDVEVITEWMRDGGEALPTVRQAQDIASRVHVPFGYLFIDEPPNDDLKGVMMSVADGLLAALIDWQMDLAIPDAELDAALADLGREGDANAADMVREVKWTLYAAIRSLEALSDTLHDSLDLF